NDENSDGYANIGETITYNFTVTNQGQATITDVVLTDDMLGGELTLASGDDNGDNILDVDEVWLYAASYTITQADIDTGMVSNQALVTGTSSTDGSTLEDLSDDDTVFEDDITDTELPLEAGIAVIKTGVFYDENSDGYANLGETITYNFTVTNQGQTTITYVVLTDDMLGGELTLASGDDNGDNILDVDEVWLYAASYTITQADIDAGMVSNQALVTGTSSSDGSTLEDLSDDDTVFEDDITDTELPLEASIAVIKTAIFNDENSDDCSNVGETITYSFTVTNEGNVSVRNIELIDDMLGGVLSLVSGDDNEDEELDVNETWIYAGEYTLTQADIDAGMVSNQAVLSGESSLDGSILTDLSDDDSVLEDDTTIMQLCNSGSISLEKVGEFNDENGNGVAEAGETLSYWFTVYNTGVTTLYNISIDDPLPGVQIEGGPIIELGPNDIDDFTFIATYTLTEDDVANGEVINQAVVEGENENGIIYTDTSDDPNNLDNIDLNNDNEPDDPTVVILPQVLGAEFEIFNGITPDGNGENDFFRIVGIEDYPDNNLKIYNRWGILIYDMDSYGINGNEFRGISEGRSTINKDEKLPTGTYFYILRRFVGGKTLTNEGYLYIKNN
ncbi:gliding motility-associated C-terminal domain-containing protein, partial [Winogradskyella sp. F6397]